MPSSEDPVIVSYQDRVAIITINRPERLNALDTDGYYALGEAMREVATRQDIFITVLTAKGRFFSAGADVQSKVSSESSGNVRRDIIRSFVANNVDITRTFFNHPKILVVALNGPAVGLSAALTGFADFVYAVPHTFLLTPFSSLGLVAEGGASRGFVERLGIAKANEALIMSKKITAGELVSAGYVNKIFAPASGKKEDSEGFLKLVLEEVEEKLGTHLNQDSLLKIKELIRKPEREMLEKQNVLEAFMGMERFEKGIPQQEFMKIATGQKKHKL